MPRKLYYMSDKAMPYRDIKTEFKAETKGDVATLYIYGGIGQSWWDEEAVSASDVRDFLKSTAASTIHVRLNSLGGDVFDGLAIYNQLKDHDANIIVHIDGIAASAGSIIAMAGDEIKMPKTSMMMIHNAWTIAAGNSKDFKKVAEDLQKINDTIIESYLPRFVGTREELEQLLDDETFLSAEEAIALGLADVVEVVEEAPAEPVVNTLLAKYAAHAETKEPQTVVVAASTMETKSILEKFKRNSNE